MKGIWTIHTIPELRRLPDFRRGQIVWAALAGAGWSLQILAVTAGVLLLAVVAAALILLLHFLRPHVPPLMIAVAGSAWALLACAALHQLSVRLLRASVRAYVKSQRRDGTMQTCLRCGYDQRGTVGERCPECGAVVASPWAPQRQPEYRRAA